jgi:hypothetical protein
LTQSSTAHLPRDCQKRGKNILVSSSDFDLMRQRLTKKLNSKAQSTTFVTPIVPFFESRMSPLSAFARLDSSICSLKGIRFTSSRLIVLFPAEISVTLRNGIPSSTYVGVRCAPSMIFRVVCFTRLICQCFGISPIYSIALSRIGTLGFSPLVTAWLMRMAFCSCRSSMRRCFWEMARSHSVVVRSRNSTIRFCSAKSGWANSLDKYEFPSRL